MPMRRWLELSAEVPRAASDALSAWLVERGAPGLIEEEAAGRVRLRAHFAADRSQSELVASARAFLGELEEFFPGTADARLAITLVDEEDWAEGWKQNFPPLEVGRRLHVRPPWSDPGGSNRHDIVILPAMAFGTGHHGSTLGCLLALEEICERDGPLAPVLDVGTGSGILAIAAARLGATEVVAIDVDPVALEAAAENVGRNRVERSVTLRRGSLEAASERYRLILANLQTNVLREAFGGFRERAAPRAWLVVSGLLDTDRDEVTAAAQAAGWVAKGARSLEGWATLTFRRAE